MCELSFICAVFSHTLIHTCALMCLFAFLGSRVGLYARSDVFVTKAISDGGQLKF